jgi:ABC-type uncharacterized transport system ATPase subunit
MSGGRMSSGPSSSLPSDGSPAIEAIGIDKRFGAVHANKQISLKVARASIHGIIGENGAGKSTLMGVLYGYHLPDAGEIRVGGKTVRFRSPEDALANGIGMVHQHFMLVETFTVLENVVLGAEGGFLIEKAKIAARAHLKTLDEEYHLEVDPDALVADLTVGQRQRVEILKALYRGADILILDEPTGVLTPQEADHLFRILKTLKQEGKTVILITHKLREILEITDAVTVMRRGEVVAQIPTAEATKDRLAELMVGRKVVLRVEKTAARPGEVILAVQDLRVIDGYGVERVKSATFEVRRGEIVGIAGVAGNGQSELLEAIAGIRPIASGKLLWKGEDITARPNTRTANGMRRLGLGHVPEDRQRMGLVAPFTADESSILGYHDYKRYNRQILLDHSAITAECYRQMREYDVRPLDCSLPTSAFSGGNQQKLVVAREVDKDPDLLLVGQPTRGVDIGAIEFIHRRLVQLRDAGKAILLVSVELDEILSLSDRVLVMFDGRIVGERQQEQADERSIGLLMAGIQAEAA